jgi:hypothetical protein
MTALSRRLVFALSIVASGVALDLPASAQLAGGRSAFDARPGLEFVQFDDFWGDRRSSNRNNFFEPFWGDRRSVRPNNSYDPYNPFNRRPQPQTYESIKPPAARKVETPPAETVLVIGDSLGEWLAHGLELVFAETPQIGVVRRVKPDLSLVRDDARLDAPAWTQAIRDLLPPNEKPNAIVVMLGVNDRAPLRERAPAAKESTPDSEHPSPGTVGPQHPPPGASHDFHTDKWAELYAKRIDDLIAALKTRGVPIMWVGLPAIRGAKSTSDMSYLDELYRARADKAGIAYIDIWDGFVDDQGRFVQDGPDFQGQTRRLRTYDGVNFTKAGAEKLGHYVEHDLRRVLDSHVLPTRARGAATRERQRRRSPGHRSSRAAKCNQRGKGWPTFRCRRPSNRSGSQPARHTRAQSRRSRCCTARAGRRLLLAASRYQRDSRYGGASRCRAAQRSGCQWRRRRWEEEHGQSCDNKVK